MLADGWWRGRRARTFTLQWHVTSACGSRCAHCYEDGPRPALRLPRMLPVLDGLAAFCAARGVAGQIAFSGGDPLLHPDLHALWAEAAARGLDLVVLGNPASREEVLALVALRRPRVWQVSLEGLEATHDAVRGPGSHARTLAFLALLRELGVRAHVMLTLTEANVDEVLPLADSLRGLCERIAWTRLARTGRGAALAGLDPGAYAAFARRWALAAARDRRLARKDGLLNLALEELGLPLAGGCTGAGCGAAFDFLAVLPDGEVHACRKVPSRVGHVLEAPLEAIWASPEAARWRAGSEACRGCRHRRRCGGCPAVTHGEGGDPLRDLDPHCPGPR